MRGPTGGLNGVVFSPDGTRVASFGMGTKVWAFDAAATETLRHERPVWDLAFDRAAARLATAVDGRVLFWDARSGRLARTLRIEADDLSRAAFGRGAGTLATSTPAGGIPRGI